MTIDEMMHRQMTEYCDDADAEFAMFNSFNAFVLYGDKDGEELKIVGITEEVILCVIITKTGLEFCNMFSVISNSDIYVYSGMQSEFSTDFLNYWNEYCLVDKYKIRS